MGLMMAGGLAKAAGGGILKAYNIRCTLTGD